MLEAERLPLPLRYDAHFVERSAPTLPMAPIAQPKPKPQSRSRPKGGGGGRQYAVQARDSQTSRQRIVEQHFGESGRALATGDKGLFPLKKILKVQGLVPPSIAVHCACMRAELELERSKADKNIAVRDAN